jgi:autophagy-related protein 9
VTVAVAVAAVAVRLCNCVTTPLLLLLLLCRCVSYLSGAIVSVLLILAVIDENTVLQVHLAGRNLVWYIAVFSAALAVSRSLIPEPEDAALDPEGAMRVVSAAARWCCRTRQRSESRARRASDTLCPLTAMLLQLVAYTHYMPKSWRNRCHTYDVRDDFLSLYRYRVELFVQVCHHRAVVL